jgi:hypothetical protein
MMQHKTTTSMYYLILGISLITILISAQSYSTDRNLYQLHAQYRYINDTDSIIEVRGYSMSIALNPKQEFAVKNSPEGPEHPTPNNFHPPFWGSTVVIFNNYKCDTLQQGDVLGEGEGILGRDNYIIEKLSERSYKFTYHFTVEDFLDATPCQ